jgi:hypothetical protein
LLLLLLLSLLFLLLLSLLLLFVDAAAAAFLTVTSATVADALVVRCAVGVHVSTVRVRVRFASPVGLSLLSVGFTRGMLRSIRVHVSSVGVVVCFTSRMRLSLLSVGVGCLSIRVPIRIYFISSDMGVIVDYIPVVMVLRTVFVIGLSLLSVRVGIGIFARVSICIYFIPGDMGVIMDHLAVVVVFRSVFMNLSLLSVRVSIGIARVSICIHFIPGDVGVIMDHLAVMVVFRSMVMIYMSDRCSQRRGHKAQNEAENSKSRHFQFFSSLFFLARIK